MIQLRNFKVLRQMTTKRVPPLGAMLTSLPGGICIALTACLADKEGMSVAKLT